MLSTATSNTPSFDWILWIDSDAIVVNITVKLDNIVNRYANSRNTSLLFSGDKNIINSGVLLIRNTLWMSWALAEVWKIGEKLLTYPRIGMGYDNAAFSIFLSGCRSFNSYTEFKICYNNSDLGYLSRENQILIENADPLVLRRVISPEILPYVAMIPRKVWNSNKLNEDRFILHLAGVSWKTKDRIILRELDFVIRPGSTSADKYPAMHHFPALFSSIQVLSLILVCFLSVLFLIRCSPVLARLFHRSLSN